MFGIRSISDFRVFLIWKYLHRLDKVCIPNPKLQNLKLTQYQKIPDSRAFWIFRLIMDTQTVYMRF